MEELRVAFAENAPVYLLISGLVIGAIFGAIVYWTNFCTMGAISDFVTLSDYRRFRSWLLAAATGLVGAQILAFAGVVDLSLSMYLTPNLTWVGYILGGLMFGFGMVFSGGCASRNVARVGGGDMRALFTLIVMGIFAYMAIGGLLGPMRATITQLVGTDLAASGAATQSLGELIAGIAGLDTATGNLALALAIGGAVALYCFMDPAFRISPPHIIAGIGIGLCVAAGWAATGLAYDEFADTPMNPISLTYVRPTGDTLEWMQRYTALGLPSFGVATVFGGILGAFAVAMAMGRFHLITFFDTNDTLRSMFGAALMGVGGVMALGCTVGQALTGVSTLAIGSFVTFAAIVAGGMMGVKALERIIMAQA